MHTLAVTGFRPDPFASPDVGARPRSRPVTAMPSGTTSVEAPDEERADVASAAAGDRRAFERLYRTHGQRILALCLRMTADRHVAEDLVQDVFVRAWQTLDGFRGDAAFGTWLHRVAVNIVLSRRRRDGVQRDRTTDDDASLGTAPARPVHVGDRLDLEAAIAALPPGARRIFVLHDVEGYTHEEIGDLLGITSGGSKAQLHRARLLLREALTR
jgi:RNA polymerase sigma-70 factor (ECF subfamily)